ncbi:MAG: hypothetical protein AB7E79_07620 [Rhodospirillaceae bacterium]
MTAQPEPIQPKAIKIRVPARTARQVAAARALPWKLPVDFLEVPQ